MSWSRVIDQERVCETLRRAVQSQRVPHAYLFHGPEGTGKRAAALAFAQVLQCEQQSGDEPSGQACAKCRPCTKVRRMLHPDVHVFIPHPKGVDVEDLTERIQLLGENPYEAVDYASRPSLSDPSETSNKQAFYPLERIREDLLRPMSLRPNEGRYKVSIITEVENMRTEAANAFLKLLEEPPERTIFILTTSRAEQLLPTIVSRCQLLRFEPLGAEAISEALVERESVPEERAEMLARMADGSYTRALNLTQNEELLSNRELVLDFFRYSYTGKPEKLTDLIGEIKNMGRERMKGVFDLMLRWLRDLMLYRAQGENARLVNVDQAEAAKRFCNNVPDADLKSMIALVEEAIELTERNVHAGLLITSLSHELRKAMHGAHPGTLYKPLPESNLHVAQVRSGSYN